MSAGTNPFLRGNFAPIGRETTAFDLPVTGELPRELTGRLLRIGPDPLAPDPERHHWFLGHGMVHGVRLREGRAEWYRSRWVRDDQVARIQGGPTTPGPRHNPLGEGVVNTHVIGHAGRTFALVEAGSLPVELGYELETRARCDFGGSLPAGFSAHTKRDPESGELWAAVYSPFAERIDVVVVGTDARVRRHVAVPVPGRPMVHDCALTERYFVLLDLPVTFDARAASAGGTLPYRWNPDYGARVGLLPREGSPEDVVWCEVEPCYVFHPMNAFESPERVVLDVVRHPKVFDRELRGPDEGTSTLERWTLDPATGRVEEQRLDGRGQEFPRHDERRVGRPYRHGYTVELGRNEKGLAMGGLLKHDLQDGKTQRHHEGPARQFMEPVFVPRSHGAAEDDGWLLAYVHDASRDRADVVVLHAQDFAAAPVATVHLPIRVPFGFHGSWVPDEA